MSVSFLFFSFWFLLYSMTMFNLLIKKKKKIEITAAAITTTITIMKKQRLLKSRILNVYILINTALFICSNKKAFIMMTEIWKLIWRCIKLIKILIIAFITIIFVILKLLFAFTKHIYMILTSLNKHLQAIKRTE